MSFDKGQVIFCVWQIRNVPGQAQRTYNYALDHEGHAYDAEDALAPGVLNQFRGFWFMALELSKPVESKRAPQVEKTVPASPSPTLLITAERGIMRESARLRVVVLDSDSLEIPSILRQQSHHTEVTDQLGRAPRYPSERLDVIQPRVSELT